MNALDSVNQGGFDPEKTPAGHTIRACVLFEPSNGFYTRLNFLGEEGVDSGSLRRELWRLVARNAQGFLGCGNQGRCKPIHSVSHLSVRNHVLLTAIVNRSMLL